MNRFPMTKIFLIIGVPWFLVSFQWEAIFNPIAWAGLIGFGLFYDVILGFGSKSQDGDAKSKDK